MKAPDTLGPSPTIEPTAGLTPSTDDPKAIRRPGSRWLRVVAVVGPVVALLVATLAPAGLMALLPAMEDDTPAGAVVVVVVVQSLVVCLLALLLCMGLLRLHGLRLRDAGFRWTRVSLPSLGAGLAVGATVIVAVGLPLTRLGLLRTDEGWDLPWWALIVAGLAQALLLQGLPEEVLFRGYQMTALRLRPLAALVISSSVFGALHLISNGGQTNALERALYLVLPFGFAFAGGALMIVTDSLWAAVGVHTGVHVGFLIGLGFGIGNGPWLWLTCGAVWILVGVVLLAVAHCRGRLAQLWRGPQH